MIVSSKFTMERLLQQHWIARGWALEQQSEYASVMRPQIQEQW